MSLFLLYALTGAGIFVICLHALINRAHLLRKVLALNMMGSSVFLILIAIAWRNREAEPDPVPHAMVLTGLVVAVSTTALALALVRRHHAATGATDLSDEEASR